MRVLIACDKFKGSLSSPEVNKAIEKGIKQAHPEAETLSIPIADGGDGSLTVIASMLKSEQVWVSTYDPLGRPIKAHYLLAEDTAFIEMAQASGLVLLSESERNPLLTSTIGTGQLIKHALDRGLRKLVLLIGGSATNDAGLGIAHALGFRFLDVDGRELYPSGQNLGSIHQISPAENLPDFNLSVLTDVSNPFIGENGAVYTYAKQKGANEEALSILEKGMIKLSQVFNVQFGIDISQLAGAGAAGGISGGLHALLGANIKEGFPVLAELTQLEEKIQNTDLVISGEGQFDIQSVQGKVVGQIADLCLKYNKKLIVVAGNNTLTPDQYQKAGISAVYHIMSMAENLEDAMKNGSHYLQKIASKYIH